MSVAAALHGGAGLVSAFVPESIAPAMAARWPEAMWVGCPETPDGGIAMESGLLIRRRLERASALLVGPGLGRESETMALIADLLGDTTLPLVLDADALQKDLVETGDSARILTPHQGEFERISGGGGVEQLRQAPFGASTVTVLKGAVTRIGYGDTIWHGLHGGPELARGGSGDLLAGLIGARLAAQPQDPLTAAAQGVVWHGLAAASMARRRGETALTTTALLTELNHVLREED